MTSANGAPCSAWRRRFANCFLFLPIAVLAGNDAQTPEPPAPPEPNQLVLFLPYPVGRTFACAQGLDGDDAPADLDPNALDFPMPVGTPIVAAAAGIVVEVRQDSKLGGPGPQFIPHANRAVIDHGNGVFTRYLHLDTSSCIVAEGARVDAGQPIGKSGNTGRSSEPHLRFILADVWGKSLPARFSDLKDATPTLNQRCMSRNVDKASIAAKARKPAGARPVDRSAEKAGDKRGSKPGSKGADEPDLHPEPSNLPADAFSFNAVEVTSKLPAVLYEYDWTYVINGRVTNDSDRVVFFLTKRGGEGSETFFIAPVSKEHTFTLVVTLKDKADKLASGLFSYALASVPADGNFKSARMLPLVMVKK